MLTLQELRVHVNLFGLNKSVVRGSEIPNYSNCYIGAISMNIYKDRKPYTYLIGWTKLNIWYYGRRTKKGCDPNELWKKYFTSSVYVQRFRETYGEPDIVQVRKIFIGTNSVVRCSRFEEGVIRRLKAVSKPNWLNKGNGGAAFNTSGLVIGKDPMTGKTAIVDMTSFGKTSKVVGINFGIIFDKSPCCYCNTEIPINNLPQHQLYCKNNPDRKVHSRIGVPLTDDIKSKMRNNHSDVSGTKNPNSKVWKLTSPTNDVKIIAGNLDSTLRDMKLSRFNLLVNLGSEVPKSRYNRSELSKNTVGWKLEQL